MTDRPQSLDDWLQYIESVHPVGWDLGLDRVSGVATRMGLLHPGKQVVLIAGTNGKGSTCEVLSRLLGTQGFKVGKSTSPHLIEFNERIQINDTLVADSVIVDAFEQIEFARGDVTLTYFEFATLASLYVFEKEQVDVAILEIGLGGRLDAMNVVSPDLSIITSIALDHQNYLGDTREAIAREKAGIMRPGVPCIIADPNPPDSLAEVAAELNTPVSQLGRDFYCDSTLQSDLPAESVAAAIQAFTNLGGDLTPELRGLVRTISLAGRMQRQTWLGRQVILDVAHNPEAARRLFNSIERQARNVETHAVVGIYRDKDVAGVMRPFLEVVDHWYTVAAKEARALPEGELMAAITGFYPTGESGKVMSCDKMEAAAEAVVDNSQPGDLILVFGSFPIVAQALAIFN